MRTAEGTKPAHTDQQRLHKVWEGVGLVASKLHLPSSFRVFLMSAAVYTFLGKLVIKE